MKNKNGFVLAETIIVVAVLSILLVLLYSGYVSVITASSKKTFYDNTEYLYKTELLKEHLKEYRNIDITSSYLNVNEIIVFCEDNCANESVYATTAPGYATYQEIVTKLGIKAIYFSNWNTHEISSGLTSVLPTTQLYIKKMDPKINTAPTPEYRIIVMFDDANSDNDYDYQYASLRY